MKKKFTLAVLTILAIFLLTACGGKKSGDITVDITKLCDDLKATVTSGDLIIANENNLAATYFFEMDKLEESIAALNSGANACEVAIVKCKDSDYVSEVQDLFKGRVQNQSNLFADYNAAEVSKLDAAIIKSAGNYVVFCVTDDTAKAEEVLKKAGF
ncbi:MAG: DUF4358 domain-containing protein [Eubacteriales bacterium]|nr:DUF4358 domain-containing protein [Eubacteriales bacterium]